MGRDWGASFGLDEATALDLAWQKSRVQEGFILVDLNDLMSELSFVEKRYGNAGFSSAKLKNALQKLILIGMINEAGTNTYQLIERIKVSGSDTLRLSKG